MSRSAPFACTQFHALHNFFDKALRRDGGLAECEDLPRALSQDVVWRVYGEQRQLLERPARWETAEADHQQPVQTGSSRTDFVGHRQPPTQNGLMDLSWAMAAYWSISCRRRES